MATPIIDHNLLTLDYWQDSVTYEGKTVPGGTIGCEALNIPDTLREKLAQARRIHRRFPVPTLLITTGVWSISSRRKGFRIPLLMCRLPPWLGCWPPSTNSSGRALA